MKHFYPPNLLKQRGPLRSLLLNYKVLLFVFTCALFLVPSTSNAQVVYSVLQGTESATSQNVNPFATFVRNQRMQFLYVGTELQLQDAPAGYITAISFKILNLPVVNDVMPENINIKMGLTSEVVLPTTLIEGLTTYYSSAQENILTTGWHTMTLDTPFEWDGYSNFIIEICRANELSGLNYEIEIAVGAIGEYRNSNLFDNLENSNGCALTGETELSLPNRRLVPSMQFTMTNPCSGSPIPGVTTVVGNNYCSQPFTLVVEGGSVESGLAYQWQSTTDLEVPFQNIIGATSSSLTTTQDFGTYYRRAVECLLSGITTFPIPVFVNDSGCYCEPTVTVEDVSGISKVILNEINNSSETTNTYTNFKSIHTDLPRDSTFDLSVNITSAARAMDTKAWIDWNQDGVFDSNESYNLGSLANGVNVSSGVVASVTVPADAILGETVMRVRSAYLNAVFQTLEPCGIMYNGETEDYIINVEETLGLNQNVVNSNLVDIVNSNNIVSIRTNNQEISAVKIYDIAGRLVYSVSNLDLMEFNVNLSSLPSQILIVQVTTISGQKTIKKIVL